MNDKLVVLSSYADLSRISASIRKVHFRKFISRKLLDEILLYCPNLKEISVSGSAAKRVNDKLVSYIADKGLKVAYTDSSSGRPNLLMRRLK